MLEGGTCRIDVATIIGTRPEAIKMAPVLRTLRERGLTSALVCTGQHGDLDLPGSGVAQAAAAQLGLNGSALEPDRMCDRIEALACAWLHVARPRLLLVHGDTNSAVAAARAARRCGIPVGHVEAGLRTFDIANPWPEERNRVEIDSFAALLFAPTPTAVRNLRAEGVPGAIIECGNSGIDALLGVARNLPRASQSARQSILVTMHRRENRGAGVRSVGCALRRIAGKVAVDITVPLHPNQGARNEMISALADVPHVRLLEPQSYEAMVGLILQSRCILTDSGGLQEEAAALGRPVLVLRTVTERPEVIESGNAMLVGTDPARVVEETLRLLRDDEMHARMSRPAFPFGTGGAAARIADSVVRFLQPGSCAVPNPPLDHPATAA